MKITFLVSGSIKSNFSYRPLALARALHAKGHDVSLIAPKADKYNNFIPENITNIDGVKILQPFQFATKRIEVNLFPYLFGAAKLLLREKPDFVYIYKPTPVSVVGLVSKLFRGTKTIADFDDLGSEVMRIEGHPVYQRKLVEWSERLAARYADRLVVAFSYLHDMYRKEFANKSILIIPNGIESDWFDAVVPSTHPRRIVFLGAVNRTNILEPLFDVLPKVIQTHADVEVLIIGDGKFLKYFKEKVASLGISKHVTFTGWLPIEKAKPYLHAGDIGYNYMPDEVTTRAASNMKVSQYMARGVVPLVTNVGDLKSTVDFGNAGYICKDTPASLEETLLLALEDPKRTQKSEQARLFAHKELYWESLASVFDEWILSKKKNETKKVYLVTTSVPGNFGGANIRNYNLIKQLVKHNDAQVEVFSTFPGESGIDSKTFDSNTLFVSHTVPNPPPSFITILRALIERVPPYMTEFKVSGLGDVFRKACEESLPDVVQIEQLNAYYAIRPHISWLKSRGVKIVFDCHNIEWRAFQDSLSLFSASKKLIGLYLTPHLKKLEIEATQKSDIVIACSSLDAEFFRHYNKNTHVIPNGVDCSEFHMTRESHKPTLVFMGGSGYPPNADAIRYYLRDIHKTIKEKVPDVQLLAIGVDKKWMDEEGIDDSSVHPLGFVADVLPYLQEAIVGICPIRYGSGTRIKIMTYMAAGLAVVSTTKGAEGVDYVSGRDIILVDDVNAFAEAVIKLLQDGDYCNTLSENGKNFILKNYDWDVIGKDLTKIYNDR